uniref:Transmembrane 9 superfamily member n=1 Tax=Meloidogyne incognita TaxID=6306 RepID=A0A914NJE1_MELIC
MYSRVGGKRWIKQMFIGALLLPSAVAGMVLGVNAVAIGYHASRAIPFTTMLVIVSICAFVIIPLNLIGTLIGRSIKGQADIPCRINVVPRPIPDKKWYLEPFVIAIIAGFLPFGSIFIEMYVERFFKLELSKRLLEILFKSSRLKSVSRVHIQARLLET